jgi:O-antigen/teichoic acid export membrane protein
MSSHIYGRIFKSSAVYSIAVFAPSLTSLILLSVYTRYLSTADYAILELIDQSRNLISMLLGGRFGETLCYFYAKAEDEKQRNATVGTGILGGILVGGVIAALGCLVSAQLSQLVFQTPQWAGYFVLSFVTLGLGIPVDTVFAWLRSRDHSVLYVTAAVARLLIGVMANASLIIVFHKGVAGVLWGSIISTGAIAVAMCLPSLWKVSCAFVLSVFWKMLRFTMPLGLVGLALFVIHYGDRFFLQRYVPLAEVGIYSVAYKLGMMISMPQTAFNQYWSGQVYFLIRGEGAVDRFARINTYAMLVLAFCGTGIVVFTSAVIHTFTTPQFWAAIPFVPGVVAAYLIRAQADYLRSAFYIAGKPGTDAQMNWIAAGVCLAAYFALIPRFHLWGGVAATVIAFVTLACIAWFRIRKLAPYYLETGRLAKVFGTAVALGAAGLAFHPATVWMSWVCGAGCVLAFPCTLYALGFFTDGEKQYVLDRLRRTPMVLTEVAK